MATFLIGAHKYEGCYAIEYEDQLFGPFLGLAAAHAFALERFDPPYTLHDLMSPTGSKTEENNV